VLYDDTVVIVLGCVPYPDAVAEVADFFMRLEIAKWSVCLAPHEGFLHVSLRTTETEGSAGRLLASILPSGMAGGHGMIAGGKVKLTKETKKLCDKIAGDILRALGKSGARRKIPCELSKTKRRHLAVSNAKSIC